MNAIAILFVVGVILLAAEVFVPGGILGVMGGLAMLAGCAVAFLDFGMVGGLTATAVALGLVGIMLWIEFAILPKTAMGQRLFLRSAITGQSQTARTRDYQGSIGETVTKLAPSGFVVIDGERLEAFSRFGFLEEGVAVKVVGADSFRLIVTPTE